MDIASVPNLLAVTAQMACVAIAGGAAIVLLRITSPQLGYLLWRVVLVVCLAVPWLQTPVPPVAVADGGSANAATFATVQSGRQASRGLGVDWAWTLAIVIAAGVAVRLVWVTVGLLRLRRLRASGDP